MAWGQVIADSAFLNTVSTGLFGEDSKLNNLVNLFGAGYGLYDNAKKNATAEGNYTSAIATQKQLIDLLAKQSQAQTQYDNALRDRLLTQTGDLSASLKQAYTDLGPQPIVNSADVAADYGAIKATKMADFNDMMRIITSQSEANQIDRLGGARSESADAGRQAALAKQFAPQLMAIDNDAMNEAYARNRSAVDLYNTNRSNILSEITGVLAPGIAAETNLYKPEYTASASTAAARLLSDFSSGQAVAQKNTATNAQASLGDFNSALAKLFGITGNQGGESKGTEKGTYTVPTNAPGGGIGGGQQNIEGYLEDGIVWNSPRNY